jgi:hypothetical protein
VIEQATMPVSSPKPISRLHIPLAIERLQRSDIGQAHLAKSLLSPLSHIKVLCVISYIDYLSALTHSHT